MKRSHLMAALGAAALTLLPAAAAAQFEGDALLRRAAEAMGADKLKTLRYTASGSGASFGQAYKPGGAWPKTNYAVVRSINYDSASMRNELTQSRAETTGGSGLPLSGEARSTQLVSGALAWNLAGNNAVPAAGVNERMHDLWITPHGVLRAAQVNRATLRFVDGGKSVVSFREMGRFEATATLGADYLVEKVESRLSNAVMGDVTVVTTYSDYRDFGGVKFPSRIRQTSGGFPVLDLQVGEVQPNAAVDIAVPDAVKTPAAERVTTDKIVEGVWFVAGGSHNSVAIEMKDYLVLVETPLSDARTAPVIEAVKALAKGKPIRYAINSHNHFDHSGGLRAAAADGATLLVHSDAKPFFSRVLANPARITPDRLARSGRKPKVEAVGAKRVLSDGTRRVEIHPIAKNIHADAFLMVYLPNEKLLIEADAFTPPPPGTPAPAKPSPVTANLVENIDRLKLSVERILPLHGRVVPVAELYNAVGRKP